MADMIHIDHRSVTDMISRFAHMPSVLKLNLAGAVNETLKEGRTKASSEIREEIKIKKRDVDKYIQLRYAKFENDHKGTIIIERSARIPLRMFGAKQTREGVRYEIREGARKTIPGAFGPPGVRRVYRREGRKDIEVGNGYTKFEPTLGIPKLGLNVFMRTSKKRLPLRGPMKGPSPWGVFVKKIMAGFLQEMPAILAKNVEQRIAFIQRVLNGESALSGAMRRALRHDGYSGAISA
jgi:hypothetical protein